jgi:hypothetical protein
MLLATHLFVESGMPPERKAALKSLKIIEQGYPSRPGSFFQGMTGLERLAIAGSFYSDIVSPLSNALRQGELPSLRSLMVACDMNDEEAIELVTSLLHADMPHFKALRISHDNLTDVVIEPLLMLMPRLEVLDCSPTGYGCLYGFSREGIKRLRKEGKAHKVKVIFQWSKIENDASW